MHLSHLLIDVGEDPDHPRPGRLWLRNLYRVHQRLCMAFPSASRKGDDTEFLNPYKPDDFGLKQVHIARGVEAGFLFRIDPQPGGGVVILVQSAVEPDWDYAFHNAGYLLAAAPQMKPFDPQFNTEERLRFRLLANPVRKVSRNSLDAKGKPLDQKWIGKRVPVPAERLGEWLIQRAESAGFRIDNDSENNLLMTVQPGYTYFNADKDNKARLRSVRFDGILKVTDPAQFHETVAGGIGPGKAFGFGLLSVAKA